MVPEWLAYAETVGFVLMTGSVLYNRAVSWKRFHERTALLEHSQDTFREDIRVFKASCDSCRSTVRSHHEEKDTHVSVALKDIIIDTRNRVEKIESILMHMNGGSHET
jgi:hypothetical protein